MLGFAEISADFWPIRRRFRSDQLSRVSSKVRAKYELHLEGQNASIDTHRRALRAYRLRTPFKIEPKFGFCGVLNVLRISRRKFGWWFLVKWGGLDLRRKAKTYIFQPGVGTRAKKFRDSKVWSAPWMIPFYPHIDPRSYKTFNPDPAIPNL